MSETNTPPASLLYSNQQPQDLEEEFLEGDEPQDVQELREGLPSGYRMRHDAHYLDHLEAASGRNPLRIIRTSDITAPPLRDDADLGPLVSSIAEHGVLQPLLVRSSGSSYELIAGRRRLAAAAAAGLAHVPCFVHEVDPVGAERLIAAEALRAAQPVDSTGLFGSSVAADHAGAVFSELHESIGAIGTCLSLLPHKPTGPRARGGTDLIRAEVARAGWLVQAAQVLREEPIVTRTELKIGKLVAEVVETLAPECRLSAVEMTVDVREPRFAVPGDVQLIRMAIGAAALSCIALLQRADGGRATLRVAPAAAPQCVAVEVSQSAVSVPAAVLARFIDIEWSERPGGPSLGVLMSGARRVAALHGGRLDALAEDRGGVRFRLWIPAGGA